MRLFFTLPLLLFTAIMPTTTSADASDLETLTRLNDDYIQSVQHSNVARFREAARALGF